MGARDMLAMLNIGLEDTLADYAAEQFAACLKKMLAFQPRVIEQNRGTSGEGSWIIQLKAGNYCTSPDIYGVHRREEHAVQGGPVELWFAGHARMLHVRGGCGWLQEDAGFPAEQFLSK